MRKILLQLFFFGTISLVYAAPVERLKTLVTLPDHKVVELYVSGDEFSCRLHDEYGYTLLQGVDGYPYYAIQEVDGSLKVSSYRFGTVDPRLIDLKPNLNISEEEYHRKASSYKPLRAVDLTVARELRQKTRNTSGTKLKFSNIVISITFPDAPNLMKTSAEYDTIYNANTKKSLKNYYKEVSYSQLEMESTLFPLKGSPSLTYLADNNRTYYQAYNQTTNPEGYLSEDQRTGREHNLLANAINALKSQIESVFSASEIDIDNDGYVDNICFIIQGRSDGWSDLLWAHRWSLYTQDVFIHNKKVSTFVFQPENQVSVTTLCHEMFHALGAPDLYHYREETSALDPIGQWDLMHSGEGHMGAYMKYKYGGWITQIPAITTPGTYTIKPLSGASSEGVVYKINSTNASEYFVLEFRKKDLWYEKSIYGSGLVAYRVNEKIAPQGNRNGPPDEVYVYRPYGSLVENGTIAQSFFSFESRRTMIGGTLVVTPFLSDGSDGMLRIKNITSSNADQISFEVVSIPTITNSVVSQHENRKWSISTDEKNINISKIIEPIDIVVYSIDGRVVYRQIAVSQPICIAVNNRGVYVLRINNENIKVLVP